MPSRDISKVQCCAWDVSEVQDVVLDVSKVLSIVWDVRKVQYYAWDVSEVQNIVHGMWVRSRVLSEIWVRSRALSDMGVMSSVLSDIWMSVLSMRCKVMLSMRVVCGMWARSIVLLEWYEQGPECCLWDVSKVQCIAWVMWVRSSVVCEPQLLPRVLCTSLHPWPSILPTHTQINICLQSQYTQHFNFLPIMLGFHLANSDIGVSHHTAIVVVLTSPPYSSLPTITGLPSLCSLHRDQTTATECCSHHMFFQQIAFYHHIHYACFALLGLSIISHMHTSRFTSPYLRFFTFQMPHHLHF